MIKQLKPYLKNLADSIRSKLGITEPINAQDFPDKITEVYEAGKQAEYDRFWDAYQDNGKRTKYEHAFYQWEDGAFAPKYDLVLEKGYTGTSVFRQSKITNLAERLERQGVILDTTKCGYMATMFQESKTIRIPELNCSCAHEYGKNGLQSTFYMAEVETIDKMVVTEMLQYITTFQSATKLKNIVFDGVIGNNIGFGQSPLSKDSITSIVNALSGTVTGQTLTLKKSAVNTAFGINVDDETTYPEGSEYYTLRHSKDNWTFSYV